MWDRGQYAPTPFSTSTGSQKPNPVQGNQGHGPSLRVLRTMYLITLKGAPPDAKFVEIFAVVTPSEGAIELHRFEGDSSPLVLPAGGRAVIPVVNNGTVHVRLLNSATSFRILVTKWIC